MVLPYKDEMDLSLTQYSDDWKSPHLIDNPDYTEEMQRFDRWCRRCYELGRNQELNEAYKYSNNKERKRREELNDSLERIIAELTGDEYQGEKVFSDGKTHFTNKGFDPTWMDADLSEHGLPVIEIMRKWLLLNGTVAARNEREMLEEKFRAEYIFEIIKASVDKEARLMKKTTERQKRAYHNLKCFRRVIPNRRKSRLRWMKSNKEVRNGIS